MAPRLKISESEILEELRSSIGVTDRPLGFYTVTELAAELRCCKNSVMKRIREMESQGRVESLFTQEKRSDGVRHRVMAYKLKKAKR